MEHVPVKAFSMSIVPQTRSSVAPRGRSTILIGTFVVSSCPLCEEKISLHAKFQHLISIYPAR